MGHQQENLYPDLEARLAYLGEPLGEPAEGDWLESGQTFHQYFAANPIRRDDRLTTIHLCLVGDFVPSQTRIIDLARKYRASSSTFPCRYDAASPFPTSRPGADDGTPSGAASSS
jgi:hypothetical protein